MAYKIAMSTKIGNLYLDSENIKLKVQRGTKIGVLYAYSNSKALKSLFSEAKIGKLVLNKDVISGFILYNASLLKGL